MCIRDRNQDALLDMEGLDFYQFNMEEPVQLDNRLQYVISFRDVYKRQVIYISLSFSFIWVLYRVLSSCKSAAPAVFVRIWSSTFTNTLSVWR